MVTEFTLQHAINLAIKSHEGQFDKGGEPYISHPITVMNTVKGNTAKMSGVLHDIVEDTPVSFSDLETLGCPAEVLQVLRLVTHDDDFDGTNKSYMKDIKKIIDSGNQIAIDVKWADITANQDMSRIPSPTKKDYARLERYKSAKEQLRPLVSEYLLMSKATK